MLDARTSSPSTMLAVSAPVETRLPIRSRAVASAAGLAAWPNPAGAPVAGELFVTIAAGTAGGVTAMSNVPWLMTTCELPVGGPPADNPGAKPLAPLPWPEVAPLAWPLSAPFDWPPALLFGGGPAPLPAPLDGGGALPLPLPPALLFGGGPFPFPPLLGGGADATSGGGELPKALPFPFPPALLFGGGPLGGPACGGGTFPNALPCPFPPALLLGGGVAWALERSPPARIAAALHSRMRRARRPCNVERLGSAPTSGATIGTESPASLCVRKGTGPTPLRDELGSGTRKMPLAQGFTLTRYSLTFF